MKRQQAEWNVSEPCITLLHGRDKIPSERLLLNHNAGIPGLEGEFNPGPETRLDCSELLCNKVLLKYKGDRESI